MSNENTTQDLTPNAPSTNPLLKELLSDFREERAANQLFRSEVRQRLTAIETELGLMRRELNKLAGAQLRQDARIDKLEDDLTLLKAA